ncbi:hypothetical protein BASA81_004803 [Batrachochytrium salamandrivorans]|nr:hypothetical protein BASA81_004803 [Batrachochytrium salamandrivorans]
MFLLRKMTGGRSKANLLPLPISVADEENDDNEVVVELKPHQTNQPSHEQDIYRASSETAASNLAATTITVTTNPLEGEEDEPEEIAVVLVMDDGDIELELREKEHTPSLLDMLQELNQSPNEFDANRFLSILCQVENRAHLPDNMPINKAAEVWKLVSLEMERGMAISQLDLSVLFPQSLPLSPSISKDLDFARQFLESLFCTHVYALHLDSTTGSVVDWVRRLQVKQTEDQRFFYVDYPATPPLHEQTRCLFELREDELLHPVAIELCSTGETSTFLPNSDNWEVAKLFVKLAAGHTQQREVMDIQCMIEPLTNALMDVPRDHLLYQLLANHIGEASITATKSNCTIDLCLPVQLAHQGFQTWDIPECFVYYKDALRVWKTMELVCTELVFETYASEKDLGVDSNVMNKFFTSANLPVPEKRTELARALCGIVFTCTVRLAAITLPSFVHYSLVSNSPLKLRESRPGNLEWELYLPDQVDCALQIANAYACCSQSHKRFVLFEGHGLFAGLGVNNKHGQEFELEMKRIEANIKLRPVTGYGTRYEWLLPSQIPM